METKTTIADLKQGILDRLGEVDLSELDGFALRAHIDAVKAAQEIFVPVPAPDMSWMFPVLFAMLCGKPPETEGFANLDKGA